MSLGNADWSGKDSEDAAAEGWGLFEVGPKARLQLQRNDGSGVFKDDQDAWKHVAQKGSPLHEKALALLERVSRGEWIRIVGGEGVDEREVLVGGAGYRICETGFALGWYALLPGEQQISPACSDDHNYLGFFSSKADLLEEVFEVVVEMAISKHSLSESAWMDMHIDEKLGLVHQ